MPTTITTRLRLPRAHEAQQRFLDSAAKRKVILAGRRGGKTTGMTLIAIPAALEGRRVLEAAPTAEQTTAFWDRVRHVCAPLIDSGAARKWEDTRLIEFVSGGRIRCKTAYDADTLRGDYADLLLLDEFSLMQPDAWGEVGAPMLLDNDGDAVFAFTPKAKNHAYLLYNRARANDGDGRWAAFHFTSLENPYLSAAALRDITADMTADAYRQEILAEFVDTSGAVFRNVHEAATARPQDTAMLGHAYAMGVDWALTQDYTVAVVIDLTTAEVVYIDRFTGVDYTLQRERVAGVARRFNPQVIVSEANAMGRPNNELLRADGWPVQDFVTTGPSKAQLVSRLVQALESRALRLLPDDALLGELLAFEAQPLATGTRYAAPSGMHDDTVMALMLAWHNPAPAVAQVTSYVQRNSAPRGQRHGRR